MATLSCNHEKTHYRAKNRFTGLNRLENMNVKQINNKNNNNLNKTNLSKKPNEQSVKYGCM